MAEKIGRFLNVTLLQGGADAFVEASVATDLVPANGFGYRITEIEWIFKTNTLGPFTGAADGSVNWSVARDSKTAVGTYADNEIILQDGFDICVLTAVGQMMLPCRYEYKPANLIIVEPNLYLQLDSNGTGVAIGAQARIHIEEVKLTEVEILRLLNNA